MDETPLMAVDRWKHKRDGPPSQKVTLIAMRVGYIGIGVGFLGGLARDEPVVSVIALAAFVVLLLTALVVERRERRQEALEEADKPADPHA